MVALGLVTVLAVLYGTWWAWLAGEVRAGINNWFAKERADGRHAKYGALAVGGFPMRIRVVLEEPEWGEDRFGVVRADSIWAQARPWNVQNIKGRLVGAINVMPAENAASAPITMKSDRNRFEVTLGQTHSGEWRLDKVSLTQAGTVLADIGKARLQLTTGTAGKEDDILAEFHALALPHGLLKPFANDLDRVRLHAAVPNGALNASFDKATASAWHAEGHAIQIKRIDVKGGRIDVDADGTLALDGNLQPVGAFALRARKHESLLNAMAETGWLSHSNATIAKLTFGLLAKTNAQNEPYVTLPVSLQDRTVSLGPISVARIPFMAWP